jgi:hypothetical protein
LNLERDNIYFLMYRPSNERYSEGNMKPNNYPYPPEHSLPKPHPDPYASVPLYYEPQNPYEYPHNPNPPTENYDRPYPPSWGRESEPKMMSSMAPSPHSHYDPRMPHSEYVPPKPMTDSYGPVGGPLGPQVNVVQRISGLIKSQLSMLQGILSYVDKKTNEERQKRDRSRSRSRDRERPERRREHREWNCVKCNFLNFDFRDRCKKCNEAKPEGAGPPPKVYVPGPEDWRCPKCNNINYARRTECHRCHIPRGK